MKILFTDDFKESLKEILKFIKQDSKDRAYNFRDSLKNEIMKIPERPYSYRENLTMKDTQVRDLVFGLQGICCCVCHRIERTDYYYHINL